jgi:mRNA interferase MazF
MVTTGVYVPERGDIVWISLDPQAGHEQAGRRPALVLSPSGYNAKTGLAILAPITRQVKGYPYEIAFPESGKVAGVVLCDQIKNLDWRARRAEFIDQAPDSVVLNVLGKIQTLIRPT